MKTPVFTQRVDGEFFIKTDGGDDMFDLWCRFYVTFQTGHIVSRSSISVEVRDKAEAETLLEKLQTIVGAAASLQEDVCFEVNPPLFYTHEGLRQDVFWGNRMLAVPIEDHAGLCTFLKGFNGDDVYNPLEVTRQWGDEALLMVVTKQDEKTGAKSYGFLVTQADNLLPFQVRV
jgi:hypothetical protein